MKDSYEACLFSVRRLKVSSDKTECFSSVVDEIPPPCDRMISSYKERRFVECPKDTTKIHIPRRGVFLAKPHWGKYHKEIRSLSAFLRNLTSLTSYKLEVIFLIWGGVLGGTGLALYLLEKPNFLATYLVCLTRFLFAWVHVLCCDSSTAGCKEISLLVTVRLCSPKELIRSPTKKWNLTLK